MKRKSDHKQVHPFEEVGPLSQKPKQEPENEECKFCFLDPCITSHGHHWLGDGRHACEANSGIQRAKYAKYWKCISNRGGWNLDMYLAKKVSTPEGSVLHRREIMPECVVNQVRELYPNPGRIPYMGHKWE